MLVACALCTLLGARLARGAVLDGMRTRARAHVSRAAGLQVKGENTSVNVKRLPKKPAPPRFGRKLTAGEQALATHICVDCE